MADVNINSPTAFQTHCHVVPGSLHITVSAGDKVKWTNHTTEFVRLFFPHDNTLGSTKGHFHETIKPGKSFESEAAAKKGRFEYSVYCEETHNFAIGSNPEIVVG